MSMIWPRHTLVGAGKPGAILATQSADDDLKARQPSDSIRLKHYTCITMNKKLIIRFTYNCLL